MTRNFIPQILLFLLLLFTSSSLIPSFNTFRSGRSHRHNNSFITMSSKHDANEFVPTVGLTEAVAQKAVSAAQEFAVANGWRVTIAVVDAQGPLLVKRCDGAFPASFDIALGKAKTASQFWKSTGQLEDAVNVSDGSSRTALLSAPFILMRGGVPIFINGICVGAVGVSGVKPDEDEQVAMAAVNALQGTQSKL